MHILLIHQAFTTVNDAGGTRHYELARFLAERGHHTSVITSPVSYLTGKTDGIHETNEPGISIIRVHIYKALHKNFFHRVINFISFMISAFFKALSVHQVDLVWGTTPPIFQSATAWLVARVKHVPFMLEVRDLWPDFAIAVGVLKSPLLINLSRWLEAFLYRHADLVIVNSPGYVEHVKSHGAKRVELIPNGADITMFASAQSQIDYRKVWGLEGKFIILYAGAHGMSNNLDLVLQAASLLSVNPNIHFVFLGDGKEKENLKIKANTLALTNVTFIDPIPKNKMGAALQAADACLAVLLPIDWYKTTYPNKVFDYMAAGKPVLLCIDGVIRKVVEDARCGIYCNPANPEDLVNAATLLEKESETCKAMGVNGNVFLEKHFRRDVLAQAFAILVEDFGKKYA